MILGYVKCTSPGCDAAMEVSQCSGKRSKYLKGRCHTCECTEQRSNANTQNYLQAYKPLEELNQLVEHEKAPLEDTSNTLEVPQEPQSPAPNSKGSGWLCAGIGAAIGLGLGKAISHLRFV
ncbi:hypothetical protein F0267_24680 [Vibrio coralliilyticus]|nr:hypothetical protein [Vibrio coralliilyticus]NOH41427.1 hypothetical protein [Vibrio coralliilyticus]